MSDKKFKRQNSSRKLGDSWRRPKGHHSSLRKGRRGHGIKPSPGYGSQNKGMHPSGYYEVLVRNIDDLQKIDKEREAARISSNIGKRKRKKIIEKAEEMEINVLN